MITTDSNEEKHTMTKWTPEAIRALGPTTDLPTLAAIVDAQ